MRCPLTALKLTVGSPEQEKLLNFLIGQVMKATKGRANPALVRTMLLERLERE